MQLHQIFLPTGSLWSHSWHFRCVDLCGDTPVVRFTVFRDPQAAHGSPVYSVHSRPQSRHSFVHLFTRLLLLIRSVARLPQSGHGSRPTAPAALSVTRWFLLVFFIFVSTYLYLMRVVNVKVGFRLEATYNGLFSINPRGIQDKSLIKTACVCANW